MKNVRRAISAVLPLVIILVAVMCEGIVERFGFVGFVGLIAFLALAWIVDTM